MARTALDRLPPRALLDGAMGTELMARGLRAGKDCAESWNLERPDDVRRIHQAYFAAGADVVQTNTFGGTRIRLSAFGRQTDVRNVNVAGALLARELRPAGVLIAASVGPTGAIPPPEGKADLIELEDAYAEQAMALAEGGVDIIHVETMYHPKEARAALRGIHEGAPGLAVVASMTCRRTTRGYATPLGFPPEPMLAAFLEEDADGVGVNCTLAPADMLDLIRFIRSKTSKPIFARPTVTPTNQAPILPDELATGALALLAAGATAVGGCCGAGPEDIRAVRKAIDDAPRTLDEMEIG
jgi:5-methyltetrahydrofolate--homocysteine methyltransferase